MWAGFFVIVLAMLAVDLFATGGGAIVCIVQHPIDGSIYYVSYNYGDAGTVRKISYTGNRTPVPLASADQNYGPGPLTVQFNGSGSSDPDGQLLSYAWNFGDGTASGAQNPEHEFALPGTYTITLDVRDTNGNTSRKADTITVTQAASVPVTCDSGANYDDPGGYFVGTSCSPCCTELDAMAIDDIKAWSQIALLNCLGVTAGDGVVFEFNSKTFGVAYDPALNTDGSMNAAGNVFYDVVRIT